MKVDVGDGCIQNNKESKEQEQNCENDELTNLSSIECESQDTKEEQQNSEKTEGQEQETPEGKEQKQETQGGEEQPKKQLPPRPRRVSVHCVPVNPGGGCVSWHTHFC